MRCRCKSGKAAKLKHLSWGVNFEMPRTCYMCDELAVSKEHAPPRCFFPGRGAGLQLKTVHSCDLYNGQKSGDDIYVLAHICMNASRSGNLPEQLFLRSVAPQVLKKERFRDLLADGGQHIGEGVAYPVDVRRFDSFFDHLSAAMYRMHFGESYAYARRPMRHLYPNFQASHLEQQKETVGLAAMTKSFFSAFAPETVTFVSAKIQDPVYELKIAAPLGNTHKMTFVHNLYGIFEVITIIPALLQ
jgi:hypothetical protein